MLNQYSTLPVSLHVHASQYSLYIMLTCAHSLTRYESGQTESILFINNTIIRNGVSQSGDPPAVDVAPTNTKPATVHRNLQIVGNTIHMHQESNAAVVALKSVSGMLFAGNVIYSPGRMLNRSDMVASTTDCIGVTVASNNTVITGGKSVHLN